MHAHNVNMAIGAHCAPRDNCAYRHRAHTQCKTRPEKEMDRGRQQLCRNFDTPCFAPPPWEMKSVKKHVWVQLIFSRRAPGELQQLCATNAFTDPQSHFHYFCMSKEMFDILLRKLNSLVQISTSMCIFG